MYVHAAERAAIRHGALEEQVRGMLPSVADAAMRLDRVARNLDGDIGEMRLGERRHAWRILLPHVPGMGGVPDERARRLQLDGHIGELMLERLKAADQPAVLLALLGIVDRARLDGARRAQR